MSRQMNKPLPHALAKLRLNVVADNNLSTGNSLQSWLDLVNLSVPLQSVTKALTASASGALNQTAEVTNFSVSQVLMLDLRDETLISGSNQQPTPRPVTPATPFAPVTVDPGQPRPCCYSGIRCQKTSKTYSILFEAAFFEAFCDENFPNL